MIGAVIRFSARHKLPVILVTIAALFVALWCVQRIPLDAIPDLSDTQVIIYSRWDQSPDIIEDQVTYPITTALLGVPRVKAIRAVSDFGYSYVYVIFQDGTDIYWARSRVVEYLSKIQASLPPGVKTSMGPDATSVGWVYQYALVDHSGGQNLAQLRSLQDWSLRFALQAVPGVAEVAAVGGFTKEYQINVDPNLLLAYHVPLTEVIEAVRKSNNDVGGRLLEFSGTEFMVRAKGYVHSKEDLESVVIRADAKTGTPLLVRDVAHVQLGPALRRGVSDFNGEGNTVGGIIVMRQGENALHVIERVKTKLRELAPSLPPGVEIVPVYDRSDLIHKSVHTLTHALVEEMVIVSLVVLVFLWHGPSAIVPILTIPISVFLAFIPLYFMGITSNLMSLAGIAISIGVLVDGAIVEVENAYKRLEQWIAGGRVGDFHAVRLAALQEVAPSVFFSLLLIAVAFLPIFTLVDQEGRLFKPLAYSKTWAMVMAAILALTLDPAIRMLFARMNPLPLFRRKPAPYSSGGLAFAGVTALNVGVRIFNAVTVGHYYPEERHPISRRLFRIYEPACRWVLAHRKVTLAGACALILTTIPIYFLLGSEFMPPLNEGAFLYMPTALPGLSVGEAQKIIQAQDAILKGFPEVATVFGKAGRADTSTDPAPLSMVETTVVLKPDREWPLQHRWYSALPQGLHGLFSWAWPEHGSLESLQDRMDAALRFPGMPNIWTMPIKNRIDMLATGIRTPVGMKIIGPDLGVIQSLGEQVEQVVRGVRGTRSVYAERTAGGYYVDFVLRRDQLARYGLTIEDAETIIRSAIGGETISTTVEGRERYAINVRYAREWRDDLSKLQDVLVPTPSGAQIPLADIADIHRLEGPSMLREEDGQLAGYVFMDMAHRDLGGYMDDARAQVAAKIHPPVGYNLVWSGQYENILRVRERLKIVVPLTLFLIALLLYMNTGSAVKTAIVLLAVPFSLVGAVWLLFLLHYHVSVAVWVGMIALMGLDAETGVFMLLFLDFAYDEAVRENHMRTPEDLDNAIIHGAVKRLRPKMMTVCAAFLGLLPLLWATGSGADMMKRIAAPMVGGLLTSFLLELLVYPPVYALWKTRSLPKECPLI